MFLTNNQSTALKGSDFYAKARDAADLLLRVTVDGDFDIVANWDYVIDDTDGGVVLVELKDDVNTSRVLLKPNDFDDRNRLEFRLNRLWSRLLLDRAKTHLSELRQSLQATAG